jgi:hypothetical protein
MPPKKDTRNSSNQTPNQYLYWDVVYYLTTSNTVPALEFLDSCPGSIDAQFVAVLDAVATAPPPRFSGGGKWEAMHGGMGGWFEIRLRSGLTAAATPAMAHRWRSSPGGGPSTAP